MIFQNKATRFFFRKFKTERSSRFWYFLFRTRDGFTSKPVRGQHYQKKAMNSLSLVKSSATEEAEALLPNNLHRTDDS